MCLQQLQLTYPWEAHTYPLLNYIIFCKHMFCFYFLLSYLIMNNKEHRLLCYQKTCQQLNHWNTEKYRYLPIPHFLYTFHSCTESKLDLVSSRWRSSLFSSNLEFCLFGLGGCWLQKDYTSVKKYLLTLPSCLLFQKYSSSLKAFLSLICIHSTQSLLILFPLNFSSSANFSSRLCTIYTPFLNRYSLQHLP